MVMTKRIAIFVSLLLAMVSLTAISALAQITPAGTLIRNRSSATYEDLVGNTFTSISNEVITTVLPVYGVSVLPDDSGEDPPVTPALSQNALAGTAVFYRYDLTNTGNDNDSFSIFPLVHGSTTMAIVAADVTIYHDLNGNGVIDGGEPVISAGGLPGLIGPLASNQTESIIVTYTVPGGTAPGQVAYVGVDASSATDPPQFDTRNYHLTTVVSDAVMTANLSGLPAVVFEGNQITYTLSGSNTGSNAANGVLVTNVALTGVLFYDIIPIDGGTGNPLPIFPVPTGNPAGGTVLYLPAGSPIGGSPETWLWSLASAPGDIAVGYVTAGNIVPTQAYDFSYQVTVPIGMAAGVLNNDAALTYIDNAAVPVTQIVVSNNAPVTIGAIEGVVIGPNGLSGAGTAPLLNDDVTTVASAAAASSVDFTNTVRNTGNAPDAMNIILDGTSSVPGTWGVLFFQSDGITPLIDTGVDGIPDVGALAAGDSVNIVVRLVIPGTQPAGGPFDAVIRAESTNDPLVWNWTTDRIGAVVAAAADIGNYNGGAGTDDGPLNQNADPGTSVDFALDVLNPGGSPDTYTLSATIPGAWTVTFYNDLNGNGVLDGGEPAVAAMGPVAAGAELNVIARVDVPAGELPGLNATTFRATSTNSPAIFDEIANTVTVNLFPQVSFTPDQGGSTTPGGTIQYFHTITNTGNVADIFDLTYVSSQGWTYTFYDGGGSVITSIAVGIGASVAVSAELIVPGAAVLGTIETGTLTATGQGTAVTDDAIDVTLVAAGDLDLVKSVTPPGAQVPGTELTYTTDYTNLGTSTLTTIVVLDPIPAFTQYKVGSELPGTPPATITLVTPQFSDDGGATWAYAPFSGGGGAPLLFDANVTNVRFVMTGTMPSGSASAVGVSFIVRIIAE